MTDKLFLAFALMLVFEGVLPFVAPGAWREAFSRLIRFSDGQLRFVGLASMLTGTILLIFLR
ncbi:MAG: DUF2065 domain-containing protein [Candidatus Accumulibacter sp.]|jgi:uncharacterized protein YjeT (DUF2065 family)|nr:DUF2065 domain-containing protein [Accumulibacter sp.]